VKSSEVIVALVIVSIAMTIGILWIPESISIAYFAITIGIIIFFIITYNKRYMWGYHGLFNLAIPSVVISIYTFIIALPAIYISGELQPWVAENYILAVASFYILYPVGLFLGEMISPIDMQKHENISTPVSLSHRINIDKTLYYSLVLLSVFLFSLYILKARSAPFIELILSPGDSQKYSRMREEAFKTLHMSRIEQYLFSWNRSLLIPMIGVMSIFYLRINKHLHNYIIAYGVFVYGFFVNIITLEKSPAASLLLSILVAIYLSSKKRDIRLILLSVGLSLSIPLVIWYLLQFGRDDIWQVIFMSLALRLFVIPADVLAQYFVVFPGIEGHLLGRSSQLFSWMHVEGTFPVSNFVMRIWLDNPETTGFANAIYLGNYWADFGIYGVILAHVVFGLILQLTYATYVKSSNYNVDLKYIIGIAISIPIFTFGFFSSNFTILYVTRGVLIWLAILIVMQKKKAMSVKA